MFEMFTAFTVAWCIGVCIPHLYGVQVLYSLFNHISAKCGQ